MATAQQIQATPAQDAIDLVTKMQSLFMFLPHPATLIEKIAGPLDSQDICTINTIGLSVKLVIFLLLQLAFHHEYYQEAQRPLSDATLESVLEIYKTWKNNPAMRPAETTSEGIDRTERRIFFTIETLKGLEKKSGITIKTITLVTDEKTQAYANGCAQAANIAISHAWLSSPIEDPVLFKHLEAILAHECAHSKLSHIPKRVWLSLTSVLAAQLALFIQEVRAQNVPSKNKSKAMIWQAHCLFAIFAWALKHRIDKSLGRFQEFQADAWAALWTSPQQVADALEFLTTSFGSYAYPDCIQWLREGSKATHPTLNLRIKRMKTPGIEHKAVWSDHKCWFTW